MKKNKLLDVRLSVRPLTTKIDDDRILFNLTFEMFNEERAEYYTSSCDIPQLITHDGLIEILKNQEEALTGGWLDEADIRGDEHTAGDGDGEGGDSS